MEIKRHCLRCGKLGTRTDSASEEIWYCIDHGMIYRAALPPPPEPPAVLSMSAPEPEQEEEEDAAKKKAEDPESETSPSQSDPP